MKTPFPKYDEALVADIEDELDMVHLTEITLHAPAYLYPGDSISEPFESFTILQTRGGRLADLDGHVIPRLMIQSIPTETERGSMIYNNPCPNCDNFAVSWKCEAHPELKWDTERRRWVRPTARPHFEPVDRAAVDHFDPDGSILSQFAGSIPAGADDATRFLTLVDYMDTLGRLEVDAERFFGNLLGDVVTHPDWMPDPHSNYAGREEDPRDTL